MTSINKAIVRLYQRLRRSPAAYYQCKVFSTKHKQKALFTAQPESLVIGDPMSRA